MIKKMLSILYSINCYYSCSYTVHSILQGDILKINKLWKNESFHETYETANAIRNKLINIWNNDLEHDGMEVKVKWMPSKNKFVVNTRLRPDFEAKKENKKHGKNKQRNKKNSEGRMFDPSTSI